MKGVAAAAAVVWAVVAVVAVGVGGAKTTRFFRLENTRANGDVIATLNVKTRVQCSAACAAHDCDGYNLSGVAGGLSCAIVGGFFNLTEANDTAFYCADCFEKGERCTADAQCTTLTDHAHCSGVCSCVPWYQDAGPGCEPRPVALGGACVVSEQCAAATMFAECDPVSSTCSCPSDMYQDGVRCRHDFSASGFSLYDGRWVLVRSGLIPISWDLALLYCNNRYANMFIPRSSSDWSWMMSKMGILDFGCFVPINDKAVEGQLVWNDGTSIAGDTVVVWNQNVVGSGNFLLNNCAAVTKIPFVGAKTSMGLCFLLLNFVTVCEAMPEAL